MPLSMCGWKVSANDTHGCHGTPSQAEPASTPEAIWDQQSSWTLREVSNVRGLVPQRLDAAKDYVIFVR